MPNEPKLGPSDSAQGNTLLQQHGVLIVTVGSLP